jgi:Tfp pilus assembly protein PilX
MSKRNLRNKESGMALLIALMALFLISAIGLGMMYMSTGETSINANYKDTQLAFFAMRGGLEEGRDRLRSNSPNSIASAMATMPLPGGANSIVYITNSSGAGDTVDPKTASNQYFDDELCSETVTGVTCGQSIPASIVQTPYTPSMDPYSGTSSSLKYKWIRITLKQNNTFTNALVAPIDATHTATSQVCWDSSSNREVLLSYLNSLGGTGTPYANCDQARTIGGQQVGPLYIVTSLAITPSGSRRIGQYETAAENITPPPGALSLDGPGQPNNIFSNPNSNQYYVNGTDGSNSPPAKAGCTPNQPAAPAIGTSTTGVTNIDANLLGPPDRSNHYTGSTASPSVVDETTQLSTTMYANPSTLNNLVSMLANGADYTLNSCSMNGSTYNGNSSACTPPAQGLGTTANPQITYVNGDFNMGNASGAGVLVVTGDLNVNGNGQFTGLVLVVGQGVMNVNGGGNGTFYGSMFIANTNSHSSPYSQLSSVGQPWLNWNGGGGNGIYYNSCWADAINGMHYMVVASREEMY